MTGVQTCALPICFLGFVAGVESGVGQAGAIKEMHLADDCVDLQDQFMSWWRRERRGVVDEVERPGMPGDRPEVPRDQSVFTGFL